MTLSPLHGYSIILDYCYFMYLYHHYTDIVITCTCIIRYTRHCISCIHLLHLTLLFHVLVSPLHGCSTTSNTIISYTCITFTLTLFVHVLISMLHGFTCIQASTVLVFMLLESLFLLRDLLLHEYSYIPVT